MEDILERKQDIREQELYPPLIQVQTESESHSIDLKGYSQNLTSSEPGSCM